MRPFRAWFYAGSWMSDVDTRMVVDLFCEDRMHEAFLRALIARIGREEGARTLVRVRSAWGGHPRAVEEFKLYQRVSERMEGPTAEVLVVGIDGNCSPFAAARDRVVGATRESNRYRLVVASPDPHVERWYLSDPKAVLKVAGASPGDLPAKCERHYYKNKLRAVMADGGNPSTLGGPEIAEDLVAEMDLYKAGKNDSSLGSFIGDLRNQYRRGIARRRNA